MSPRPPIPTPAPRRGLPRLRRRVALLAATVGLAVVAFLPGTSVFGDSTPSQARTVAPVAAPVR